DRATGQGWRALARAGPGDRIPALRRCPPGPGRRGDRPGARRPRHRSAEVMPRESRRDYSTLETWRMRAMRMPELVPPLAVQPPLVCTPTIWPELLRTPEPELP